MRAVGGVDMPDEPLMPNKDMSVPPLVALPFASSGEALPLIMMPHVAVNSITLVKFAHPVGMQSVY